MSRACRHVERGRIEYDLCSRKRRYAAALRESDVKADIDCHRTPLGFEGVKAVAGRECVGFPEHLLPGNEDVKEMHLAVLAYLSALSVEDIACVIHLAVFAEFRDRSANHIHMILARYGRESQPAVSLLGFCVDREEFRLIRAVPYLRQADDIRLISNTGGYEFRQLLYVFVFIFSDLQLKTCDLYLAHIFHPLPTGMR